MCVCVCVCVCVCEFSCACDHNEAKVSLIKQYVHIFALSSCDVLRGSTASYVQLGFGAATC